MKSNKFEDALKDYLEEMKRTGWYTKAYKAFVAREGMVIPL